LILGLFKWCGSFDLFLPKAAVKGWIPGPGASAFLLHPSKERMSLMKPMNKSKVMGCLALLSFVILAALWVYSNHSQSGNKNKYVREYVIGAPGIKGSVDITQWGDDPAYHIGADRKGYAVFKDPEQAFARVKIDYAAGIEAIRKEFELRPLSMENYQQYGTYGWQLTETEDADTVTQSQLVTAFMDIFENSYVD
jgi:hypothetical protein